MYGCQWNLYFHDEIDNWNINLLYCWLAILYEQNFVWHGIYQASNILYSAGKISKFWLRIHISIYIAIRIYLVFVAAGILKMFRSISIFRWSEYSGWTYNYCRDIIFLPFFLGEKQIKVYFVAWLNFLLLS